MKTMKIGIQQKITKNDLRSEVSLDGYTLILLFDIVLNFGCVARI